VYLGRMWVDCGGAVFRLHILPIRRCGDCCDMPRVLTSESLPSSPKGMIYPAVDTSDWRAISLALDLTDRENQVVRCMLKGRDQDEIALELGISRHTVHTHLDRVYRKLRIGNRFQLLLRVFAEYVRIS